MAKPKRTAPEPVESAPYPPAMSPEDREAEIIALAYNLAEQHMRDGTATSQEITHFLQLGSTKEKLRREKEIRELDLLIAKTEALKAEKEMNVLYSEAIEAMKRYRGGEDDEDTDL